MNDMRFKRRVLVAFALTGLVFLSFLSSGLDGIGSAEADVSVSAVPANVHIELPVFAQSNNCSGGDSECAPHYISYARTKFSGEDTRLIRNSLDSLPAWRWRSVANVESNLPLSPTAPDNFIDNTMRFVASLMFLLSSLIWSLILWVIHTGSSTEIFNDQFELIDNGFRRFGRAMFSSGLVYMVFGAALVYSAVQIFTKGFSAAGKGVIRTLVPLTILMSMLAASGVSNVTVEETPGALADVGSQEYRRGSPTWYARTGTNIIDQIGRGLVLPFEQTFDTWDQSTATPGSSPNCESYISVLNENFKDATAGVSSSAGATMVKQTSMLWERSYKRNWEVAQFGDSRVTPRVSCHMMEEKANVLVEDRFEVANEAYSHIGGMAVSVVGPYPTKDYEYYMMTAWSMCSSSNGAWTLNGDFAGFVQSDDAEPDWNDSCNKWWTGTQEFESRSSKGCGGWTDFGCNVSTALGAAGGFVVDVGQAAGNAAQTQGNIITGDVGGAIDNLGDLASDATLNDTRRLSGEAASLWNNIVGADLSSGPFHFHGTDEINAVSNSYDSQGLIFLTTYHGKNSNESVLNGLAALVSALLYGWAIGGMGMGILLAQILLIVIFIMAPLFLVLSMWPGKADDALVGKFVKSALGLIGAKWILSITLSILYLFVFVFDQAFASTTDNTSSIIQSMVHAFAPVLGLVGLRWLLKQLNLPNVLSFKEGMSSPLAFGAAGGTGVAGLGAIGLARMYQRSRYYGRSATRAAKKTRSLATSTAGTPPTSRRSKLPQGAPPPPGPAATVPGSPPPGPAATVPGSPPSGPAAPASGPAAPGSGARGSAAGTVLPGDRQAADGSVTASSGGHSVPILGTGGSSESESSSVSGSDVVDSAPPPPSAPSSASSAVYGTHDNDQRHVGLPPVGKEASARGRRFGGHIGKVAGLGGAALVGGLAMTPPGAAVLVGGVLAGNAVGKRMGGTTSRAINRTKQLRVGAAEDRSSVSNWASSQRDRISIYKKNVSDTVDQRREAGTSKGQFEDVVEATFGGANRSQRSAEHTRRKVERNRESNKKLDEFAERLGPGGKFIDKPAAVPAPNPVPNPGRDNEFPSRG